MGPPEQASHPCNCVLFCSWTWMKTLTASRFWLLNQTLTLLYPSWQWYLAAKSSDPVSSLLPFLKAYRSICTSSLSGIHSCRNPIASQLCSVQSMMFKASSRGALLNLSLPSGHSSKYKHRRSRKNTRRSMQVSSCFWGLGPLLWDRENERSSNFWW